MQVYKLSIDSQFFWNDGINFPSRGYIDNLTWTRLSLNNVNMVTSYETVEIITDTPANYFKIVVDNRTLYYMTRNFKIANGKYVNSCEIDYWGSFLSKDTTFLNTQFNFIRQPLKDNLRWFDYEDPLLQPYKTTKKKIATHLYTLDDQVWYKDTNFNSMFYAVFAFSYKDYENKSKSNIYTTSNWRSGNNMVVKFNRYYPSGDCYYIVPITGKAEPDMYIESFQGETSQYAKVLNMVLQNNLDGISKLINSAAFTNKFLGIYAGPPFVSFPKRKTVIKEQAPNNQDPTYTGDTSRRYGGNNYFAYIMELGDSIPLRTFKFATPNIEDSYLYQIMDFELNNVKIDNVVTQSFTINVTSIDNAKLSFTNKFLLYLNKEMIDYPINFPYQMSSVSSSYSQFLAQNTNTLDTGLKSQFASGLLGALTGITSTVGGIVSGNVLGAITGGISGISSITSTISGMTQKIANARDARTGSKNVVLGVVDESVKLSVLNNWINDEIQTDNKFTMISKWNDYTTQELEMFKKLIMENGYYGLIRTTFNASMNKNQNVLFYQLADDEALKNYEVRDNFFNNISFKVWLRNTLLNGIRIWKTR